ncbi:hypothetical protein G3580_19500 [Nitrogeniibacter mangrovi]|uniref:Immunity protein 8 of polymorphic toxin system n=1 Tax=Nitrogeniibacter mangrovi TaxID=2016596 RepID=A0A6C1B9F1_9RHOO|nr:Imm8 family immunity protein [Nitrogeniibacter mangrovi]QID19609.1 hypothetical protein G3580_19500 [Nitrogeniibacter mangrovi]
MITPVLKELFCPGLEKPALPPNPDDCVVSLQASIGPKGERGEDLFFFTVATPSGLLREDLPRWGRGILLVEAFSWVVVERAVERLLSQSRRESWAEVAAVLNHELNWEFENFKPS